MDRYYYKITNKWVYQVQQILKQAQEIALSMQTESGETKLWSGFYSQVVW